MSSSVVPDGNAGSQKITRLWIHEVYRVFYDRLVDDTDRETFFGLCQAAVSTHFKVRKQTTLSFLNSKISMHSGLSTPHWFINEFFSFLILCSFETSNSTQCLRCNHITTDSMFMKSSYSSGSTKMHNLQTVPSCKLIKLSISLNAVQPTQGDNVNNKDYAFYYPRL